MQPLYHARQLRPVHSAAPVHRTTLHYVWHDNGTAAGHTRTAGSAALYLAHGHLQCGSGAGWGESARATAVSIHLLIDRPTEWRMDGQTDGRWTRDLPTYLWGQVEQDIRVGPDIGGTLYMAGHCQLHAPPARARTVETALCVSQSVRADQTRGWYPLLRAGARSPRKPQKANRK